MDPYDACLEEQEQIGEFIFTIENKDIRELDKNYNFIPHIVITNYFIFSIV